MPAIATAAAGLGLPEKPMAGTKPGHLTLSSTSRSRIPLLPGVLHHLALVEEQPRMLDDVVGNDRVRFRGRMDGAAVEPGISRLQHVDDRRPLAVRIGRQE